MPLLSNNQLLHFVHLLIQSTNSDLQPGNEELPVTIGRQGDILIISRETTSKQQCMPEGPHV